MLTALLAVTMAEPNSVDHFKKATITVPELSTQATEANTKIETRLNLAEAVTGRIK